MAELVDALELKIEFRKECPFESDRGHQQQKGQQFAGLFCCRTLVKMRPMDAGTSKPSDSPTQDMEALQVKRVRLLASLTLMAGVGLIIALPFALRAGAEFFLPVTAALVVAIALVPMLEWFERRGVPAKLASLLCVLVFLAMAIFALAAIVYPAIDWVLLIPQRIDRVTEALGPGHRSLLEPRKIHRQDGRPDIVRSERGADCPG